MLANANSSRMLVLAALLWVMALHTSLASAFSFNFFGGQSKEKTDFLEEQRGMVAREQARALLVPPQVRPPAPQDFRCHNSHNNKSHALFPSRVDDGVCDCCDGSDEGVLAATPCPDTCALQASAEIAQRAAQQVAYNTGSKVRIAAAESARLQLEAAAGADRDGVLSQSIDEMQRRLEFAERGQREREQKREERLQDVRVNTRPQVDAVLSLEGWEDVAALSVGLMDLFSVDREAVSAYIPEDLEQGEEDEGGEEGEDGKEDERRYGERRRAGVCRVLREMDHRLEALPCPRIAGLGAGAGGAGEDTASDLDSADGTGDPEREVPDVTVVMLERLRELNFRMLEGHLGGTGSAHRVQLLLAHYRAHGTFGPDAVALARSADAVAGSDSGSGGGGGGGAAQAKRLCLSIFALPPGGPEDPDVAQTQLAAEMNCGVADALTAAFQVRCAHIPDKP